MGKEQFQEILKCREGTHCYLQESWPSIGGQLQDVLEGRCEPCEICAQVGASSPHHTKSPCIFHRRQLSRHGRAAGGWKEQGSQPQQSPEGSGETGMAVIGRG